MVSEVPPNPVCEYIVNVRFTEETYDANEHIDTDQKYHSYPRRLCGWIRLGGRLQGTEKRRLRRLDRPESDRFTNRRRSATKRAIAALEGPVILVGHSYGGVVITEAGNDPKVAGLVYIAAFALDKGESVSSLLKDPPPGASVPPILPPEDGFLMLDKQKFAAAFAGDVDPEVASFMADSQVPWGLDALGAAITQAAWRAKPSWYLVTTEDHMIPPDAQRMMSKRAGSTVVEVKSSHSVFLSQPQAVARLIGQAAKGALAS